MILVLMNKYSCCHSNEFFGVFDNEKLAKEAIIKSGERMHEWDKNKKTCTLEPTDVTNEYRLITVEHYDFGDTTYKGEYFLLEELELNRAYF